MIPIQWKQNDKKTMHVNEAENGVVYLTWPAIEKIEGIRHAFSTRIGGVSKEHLSSMNLSFSRGDDPAIRRMCGRITEDSVRRRGLKWKTLLPPIRHTQRRSVM